MDNPTKTDAFELGVEARKMGAPRAAPAGLLRPRPLGKHFVDGWDAADRMIKTNREVAKVANPKTPRSAR